MAQTIGGKETNANEKDDSPTKEVTTTKDGTKTLLDVNLSAKDIQIGAVEIKDGETDTRAKVKTDGTDNAQVVTQNTQPLPTGAATAENQETLIAASNTVNEGGIVKQLKIMNIHLSVLTDNVIDKTEVE